MGRAALDGGLCETALNANLNGTLNHEKKLEFA